MGAGQAELTHARLFFADALIARPSCAACPSLASCPPPPPCPTPSPHPKPSTASSWPPVRCEHQVDRALLSTYGLHSLRLSRAHEGSGYRVQSFLRKLLKGDKVVIGVIGGSVSMGHGNAGPVALKRKDGIWHEFVRRWGEGLGQVEWRMGAKAASGSDYFRWCYTAHIGTDVDLVLLETAVNDGFSPDAMLSSELLLRSLLSLPSRPAIIYVDSYGQNNVVGGRVIQNGGDSHNHLAIRYDIPQISLRSAALNEMMREGEEGELVRGWFEGDQKHISIVPHEMLGRLVVAYLEEQLCEVRRGGWEGERAEWGSDESHHELPGMDVLGTMPQNLIEQAWNAPPPTVASSPPTCHLALPPLSPSELVPLTPSKDWSLYSWGRDKHYLQTLLPDSSPIQFGVTIPRGAKGDIALGFLRSAQYDLGKARCVVRKGRRLWGEAVLDGWWDRLVSISQTELLVRGMKEGQYVVECRTLPEEEQTEGRGAFGIVSVMSM